jgi:pyrophosphatase PpaX
MDKIVRQKIKKNYACYLFDADGTIIDTVGLIVRCFEHTCAVFGGIRVSRRDIEKNVGFSLRKQMELYFGPLSDERFDELAKEHMDFQLKHYREHLRVFPGVAQGLACLRAAGKRLAVVTARRRFTLELYLKETGIFGFFDAIVTLENTNRHKPEPDPALEALRLLGARKEEALLIGDSRFDLECAKNAGIDSAFVKWSCNDLSEMPVQPTYCISDMSDLCI